MYGKYVYGIIKGSDDTFLNATGLGSSNPVHTIAYQGLGCLVANYSGEEFSSMPKEEIVRCLLTHQVVIEQVMKDHAVLPVKFGTILTTSDEVHNLLAQGHSQLVEALDWVKDKVQLEVAATWDVRQVLREISNEEEILREKKAIVSRPVRQSMKGLIHLGQTVKASIDRRRDSYRERMLNLLMPLAIDVQPNALISDEMVMNIAFLLDKSRQEEFDSRVKQLDNLFGNQINFRIIGPLPAYSFATIEVTRVSPEMIKEARQLLHLDQTFSEPEVRKAYRHLAAQSHPDYSPPGDELARTRFTKLRQASELLIAYCHGQGESNTNLLLNIKRLGEEIQQPSCLEISV